MVGRLDGKVAVITGAASGIGRGTVDLFVAEGARVIAADVQDDKGARLQEDHQGKAVYVHCDVTRESDIAAVMVAAQDRFGRLDCLFNNAGAGGARETSDGVTAESFDAVMHLHVRAAMFGMKYAVPIMKGQGGGSIISTASVAGLCTGFGPFLYSVAKAAIIHMTHFAATEFGPYNIRANCLCPGLIATSIFGAGLGLPRQVADSAVGAIAEGAKDAQFIPRGGLPKDIAEAALYLASDGSSFVTGHALVVDGGLTLGPSVTSQMMAFAPIVQALGLDMAALQALTERPS
ncbi:MAG: glucose 1-dehydrogenase [Alphaproteobacteria bacterium]|nr:glucose 1-dehydrogenase [Alphaproteobacteria bacterium]MDE1987866.1 glucose 1-dehydrogenase [Alphaproteobacteria bacterium]MDE2499568.1 glucose 1-dehydrogenase [Alphaproteobacteria bacterium]